MAINLDADTIRAQVVIHKDPSKVRWSVADPDGTERDVVVVDRDRLDRLREFTASALEWEAAGIDTFHPEVREATKPRLFAARAALLPTDIDPLP